MEHSLEIERIFNLGNYKSVHVKASTIGITDEQWNDDQDMNRVRSELALEILLNFALLQEQTSDNAESVNEGNWTNMYQQLLEDRHGPLILRNVEFSDETEIVSEL